MRVTNCYKFWTVCTWEWFHIPVWIAYRLEKMDWMPDNKQVSFRKRATNYRALLRKEPRSGSLFYASSPPCLGRCYRVFTTHLKGGKDPYDASSYRSFSAKEPLIIGFFCGKWPIKIRPFTGLRHPETTEVFLTVRSSHLQGSQDAYDALSI